LDAPTKEELVIVYVIVQETDGEVPVNVNPIKGPELTPAGDIILHRYVLPLYQLTIPVKLGGI